MRLPEPHGNPAEELLQPHLGQAVTACRSQPEEALEQMSLGSLLYHVLAGRLWGTLGS